jgi:murein L,D-transpeptidase YafK
LICATLVRALVLSAAFAGALTPVRCLGEDGNQLPEKATKELSSPELLSLLRQKKMPKHSPIILRVFKEEAELEVPLPGNGIVKAETKRPKQLRRFNDAVAETKSR